MEEIYSKTIMTKEEVLEEFEVEKLENEDASYTKTLEEEATVLNLWNAEKTEF